MFIKDNIRHNEKYLYHITDFKNVTNILKNGLRGTDGIWFVDCKDVVPHVALNQIFLTKAIAVLRVQRKGITEKLLDDNVGEITTKHQFYTLQKHIDPKYLRLDYVFDIIP